MQLLHVDSAITGSEAVSRRLSEMASARVVSQHPGATRIYRDLADAPPPHLSTSLLSLRFGGANTSQDDAAHVAASHILEEFMAADIIVLGAPMYNFGVPSQLKAWLDHLAIAGKTFQYTESGPQGLMTGKKLIIASTRGGIYSPGSPFELADFQENYLKAFFGFLGITDITIIRAEGLSIGEDQKASAIEAAEQGIATLAA